MRNDIRRKLWRFLLNNMNPAELQDIPNPSQEEIEKYKKVVSNDAIRTFTGYKMFENQKELL